MKNFLSKKISVNISYKKAIICILIYSVIVGALFALCFNQVIAEIFADSIVNKLHLFICLWIELSILLITSVTAFLLMIRDGEK